ncbi:hypothetical protein L8C07_05630 [Paenibacillus sp. CMAA1739]|uniref:hypothetical protein n=1 Tax=Paenibacillus ottowii TaxID=2315729 RepID=UPI002DBFB2ED|nr:hypothetical protein [Paenibacillus sp. CMAA1739]MEC4565419.1 hypothetical protein [Paenibacillus sp. CMAA1739]
MDNDIVVQARLAAEKAGGYLTTELFDKYRDKDKTVTWDTYNRKHKIGFKEFLKIANIPSKDEFQLKENRTKAISNLKLLNVTQGYIDKQGYEKEGFSPSWDYISEHFGIENLAEVAKVNLKNRYLNIDSMISDLKQTIKRLGYIPTRKQYGDLKLKPSLSTIANNNMTWEVAMAKAEFNAKGAKTHDKVCNNERCYTQFTPVNDELFCDSCYKQIREEVIKKIQNYSLSDVRKMAIDLVLFGNSHQKLDEYRRL